MRLLVVLLFLGQVLFSQVEKELRPYVKQYNDSVPVSREFCRSIIKVDFAELDGDWKVHRHFEGWHIMIARKPRKMTTRDAVFTALSKINNKDKRIF